VMVRGGRVPLFYDACMAISIRAEVIIRQDL
jgi:hypothetical protein